MSVLKPRDVAYARRAVRAATVRERSVAFRLIAGAFCVLVAASSRAFAQDSSATPAPPPSNRTTPARNASAPQIVREANRLLLDEKPAEALDEYQKAEALRPDAREIAFGEGLAHYRLGEYDKSREAFHRAAGGTADRLAADALYSLGTCDHSEALALQDPKAALGKLESAMRNYQSVLANRADHPAARDANLKAASYWRQLKQQLEQQKQQQQQQNSDQNQDQKQDEQQQQNQQDQKQDKPSQEQQQQQADQDQKQDEKRQDQQQQQTADKDDPKQDEQKQQPQAEKEEVSREQAERKLREMMQALRDRKKLRREEVKSPPFRPSEKDW